MAARAKVLVIDDDQDFQASVRTLLESHGYQVVSAYSGEEGLQKLVAHTPNLILLDIMMEYDFDGYGVNQAIKYKDEYAAFRQVPIVMVSSIQETPDERFPMAGEVDMIRPDYYLTKPLDLQKFLDLVKQLVESGAHRGAAV